MGDDATLCQRRALSNNPRQQSIHLALNPFARGVWSPSCEAAPGIGDERKKGGEEPARALELLALPRGVSEGEARILRLFAGEDMLIAALSC